MDFRRTSDFMPAIPFVHVGIGHCHFGDVLDGGQGLGRDVSIAGIAGQQSPRHRPVPPIRRGDGDLLCELIAFVRFRHLVMLVG